MIIEYFKDCMNDEQLEKEHKRLILQMHPDRNPDDPDATKKFQEMQEQYEERKAELHGDYTKSARGRERRQREERERQERQERERKQREQNRVVEVINEARKNKGASFKTFKVGAYVYARKVNYMKGYNWEHLTAKELLWVVYKNAVAEETVVKIETIIDMSDDEMMARSISDYVNDVLGGWEVLQTANPAGGVPKSRRVSKVVMFRSEHYCVFGNPKGDTFSISDYYMPIDFADLFSDELHRIAAYVEMKRHEKERQLEELKASFAAKEAPLIDEWQDKLIAMSAALSDKEKVTVAVENLKKMLKTKFPGVTFKLVGDKDDVYEIRWMDGPTYEDVESLANLFSPVVNLYYPNKILTPWQERFGKIDLCGCDRRMTTLTKATILQQLGEVTDAFATSGIDDEVTMSYFDYKMLHMLAGVDLEAANEKPCRCTAFTDGRREVKVYDAIRYVFSHTSYVRQKKTKKAKAA